MQKYFDFLKSRQKNNLYSLKISSPVYTPSPLPVNILELCNYDKCQDLINDINNSTISYEEKQFLIKAANRHIVFNYAKIADYYSIASPEMQLLMEKSALVIIDFNDAIENGFVKLIKKLAKQYEEEYQLND